MSALNGPGSDARARWIAAATLFAVIVAAGAGIYRDFGIAWDEPVQRGYGETVYAYVFNGDKSLLADRHRVYGPVFEVFLVLLEKALGLRDLRDIYFMRHLATFVFFAFGVMCFFLLAARILHSKRLGLLGAALLVLSPRIFAHAFFNSKDIPFLAMFVICVYTLLLHLDRRRLSTSLLHGACCAVLTDMRIAGLFVPILTAGIFVYETARPVPREAHRAKLVRDFAAFLAAFVPLAVLLWPTLWSDPLGNLLFAFNAMRRFAWKATVLFMGEEVWSTRLPAHYTLVWMLITTPPACVVLGIAGALLAGLRVAGRVVLSAVSRRDAAIVLVWLVAPLVFLPASRAVLYDTWRHTFFVYPALVLLALMGVAGLRDALRRRAGDTWARMGLALLALVLIANASWALRFMVRAHPHQHV